MLKRLYVIEYRLYMPNGGAYKYAGNPTFEERQSVYTNAQRDEFIAEYNRITSLDKEIYIDNVKCYVSTGIEDITGRMSEIIDAV